MEFKEWVREVRKLRNGLSDVAVAAKAHMEGSMSSGVNNAFKVAVNSEDRIVGAYPSGDVGDALRENAKTAGYERTPPLSKKLVDETFRYLQMLCLDPDGSSDMLAQERMDQVQAWIMGAKASVENWEPVPMTALFFPELCLDPMPLSTMAAVFSQQLHQLRGITSEELLKGVETMVETIHAYIEWFGKGGKTGKEAVKNDDRW